MSSQSARSPDSTSIQSAFSNWNRIVSRLLLLTIILTSICSCSWSDDPALQRARKAVASRGDIVIGAVAPWSSIDVMLWQGIELAVAEINGTDGLLNKRKIRLLKRDDHGSVMEGVTIAQEYAQNEDLVAVIGHYQSFVTVPASVLYQYYGILLVSTVLTNPGLTQQGFSLIFRTVPDDPAFGQKLADFCQQKGLENIIVYHDRGDYGRDLADAFEMATETAGVAVAHREAFDSYTTPEQFRSTLRDWQQRFAFDAILLAGDSAKSFAFIREIRKGGFKKPILGSIAFDKPDMLKRLGSNADNVYLATTFNPNSKQETIQRFVHAFKGRYRKMPDAFAAEGYNAVYTLAYAIRQANSTSPPKIAEALRSSPAIQGVTGSYCFYPNGQCDSNRIFIKYAQKGRFVYLPSN